MEIDLLTQEEREKLTRWKNEHVTSTELKEAIEAPEAPEIPSRRIDVEAEQELRDKWLPIITECGAEYIGTAPIPQKHFGLNIDGVPWDLYSLHRVDVRDLPLPAYERLMNLQRNGVRFGWFIWAEEKVGEQPQFRLRQSPLYAPIEPKDPMLYGVIPTGENRGIWVLIAKWGHN